MEIEHTREIAAPLERLWALTVAVERWPTITPTVTGVERLDEGALQVGSRARLKQPGSPARVWTVTQLEPQRRFAWSTRVLGSKMTAVHELEATETGTRNRLRVEVSAWLGFLLRRPIAQALAAENEAFARCAEGPDA
ncbi:MAG TPA: hypothetical protein DEA08_15935 [Planctomycetes bacterium]|nr:hypothetical protein [Planctomycetota bacterium]|tara:strand:+ start:469 stop:882 length:414 start_codon:yes stop_codon:yes gene_type:complete